MSEIYSTFDGEENCVVADVSVTGFAVIAAKQHKYADILEASIPFESEIFTGQVRVESIQELSKNRTRYGLHCLVKKPADESLLNGLKQISTSVQRQHLRRMSLAG